MNALEGLYSFYEARILRNAPGYFKEFLPYIVLVSLAALADFISTYRFMTTGSVDEEFHPVIRLVSYILGPFFGPLIGKIGQLAAILFLTLLFRSFARIVFIPVIVIYLYAAWYNTWGVYHYTPLFLRLFSQ